MTDITMPQLSDSMEDGTILSWLADDGASVAVGDELLEIETDKATMTSEADVAGVLSIVVEAGATVPVGTVIARIGVDAAGPAAVVAPSPQEPERTVPVPPAGEPDGAADDGGAAPVTGRPAVSATPVARRLAAVHGVELATVVGSGPRGRVMRADVAAAAGIADPGPTVPAPVPVSSDSAAFDRAAGTDPAVEVPDGTVIRELTRLQQVVARRMTEAKTTVPEFQVQTEVVMDAALVLRQRFKDEAGSDVVVPSINDLIVKASALALRSHPLANGSYRDGRFELHAGVNVGIAVATEGALVVPVITDADQRSLGSIAAEARRLAGCVRDGSVPPVDLAGGTFTVSNLGMYGMTAITPVINVPQAAILGVGATREVLARDTDGRLVDRHVMTLTLTCDHRILYGADAARFLGAIRDLIERPLRLAL